MGAHAERGMSAPPEVVFSTALDPDRASAWLPEELRAQEAPSPEVGAEELRARWSGPGESGCSVELRVEPADAGGARVFLDLAAPEGNTDPESTAEEMLADLASEVAENLTAG